MSDEDFVDNVEHANSKLFWHCCEPWRGVQSGSGVGEPLLPSRFHGRAAELEIYIVEAAKQANVILVGWLTVRSCICRGRN